MFMTTLKELTWTAHKTAEQTHVMISLLKNTISTQMYSDLLYVKYQIFHTIENKLVFSNPSLPRAQACLNDWQTIGCTLPPVMSTVDTYISHLLALDQPKLWAHAYVHYLAPLYGGQIIAKKISERFPISMFEFDDPEGAKAEIRAHAQVDYHAEANHAFEATTSILNQLWNIHHS
jgi:heme oxygenase